MNKEIEAWKPREMVIKISSRNDYESFAKFRPTTRYRVKFAQDSAVQVNCFIRRMIRNSRANKG